MCKISFIFNVASLETDIFDLTYFQTFNAVEKKDMFNYFFLIVVYGFLNPQHSLIFLLSHVFKLENKIKSIWQIGRLEFIQIVIHFISSLHRLENQNFQSPTNKRNI